MRCGLVRDDSPVSEFSNPLPVAHLSLQPGSFNKVDAKALQMAKEQLLGVKKSLYKTEVKLVVEDDKILTVSSSRKQEISETAFSNEVENVSLEEEGGHKEKVIIAQSADDAIDSGEDEEEAKQGEASEEMQAPNEGEKTSDCYKCLFEQFDAAKKTEAIADPVWWRIADLTNRSELNIPDEHFYALQKEIHSRLNVKISKTAETLLTALAKLPQDELVRIATSFYVDGSKHVLAHLSSLRIPKQVSTEERLNAWILDIDLAEETETLTELANLKCDDGEVVWIFKVIAKMQVLVYVLFENLQYGIPGEALSERDIDVLYCSVFFETLRDVVSVHFGEICSRASRERKQQTIDASSEGSKVDWLFCHRHYGENSKWGREFGLMENSSIKLDNDAKIAEDKIKGILNMRDMLKALNLALPKEGVSTAIDQARKKILLPGVLFRMEFPYRRVLSQSRRKSMIFTWPSIVASLKDFCFGLRARDQTRKSSESRRKEEKMDDRARSAYWAHSEKKEAPNCVGEQGKERLAFDLFCNGTYRLNDICPAHDVPNPICLSHTHKPF
ncbi:hypothetical protein G9A89_017357 [Geosiphon pyriformis]|nr:hypothetical protein G9A89_017357 [Geosiphon pyriformis]